MACGNEQNALDAARLAWSQADDDLLEAEFALGGLLTVTAGTGGKLILDIAVGVASKVSLYLDAAIVVGELIGDYLAERHLDQALITERDLRIKYDQAKEKYCDCIYKSLPPDTG
jgi:hypothetical protein